MLQKNVRILLVCRDVPRIIGENIDYIVVIQERVAHRAYHAQIELIMREYEKTAQGIGLLLPAAPLPS